MSYLAHNNRLECRDAVSLKMWVCGHLSILSIYQHFILGVYPVIFFGIAFKKRILGHVFIPHTFHGCKLRNLSWTVTWWGRRHFQIPHSFLWQELLILSKFHWLTSDFFLMIISWSWKFLPRIRGPWPRWRLIN